MNPELRFEVIERDDDYTKVRISAWNGSFGGSADVYLAVAGLEDLASKIAGFPARPSNVREVLLGTFKETEAGGGTILKFHCSDQSGHAWVQVQMQSGTDGRNSRQSASLMLPVEAAAIDEFVQHLRLLDSKQIQQARLRARTQDL